MQEAFSTGEQQLRKEQNPFASQTGCKATVFPSQSNHYIASVALHDMNTTVFVKSESIFGEIFPFSV